MNTSANRDIADRAAEVVSQVRRKGVRLWLEKGQLRYKAPKGALTRSEMDRLGASRAEIVEILEKSSGEQHVAEPVLAKRRTAGPAPLTHSQLTYWHFAGLGTRSTVRHIASATRIRGFLDTGLLQRALSAVVDRHEALRTRIVVIDGHPMQDIAASGDCSMPIVDLTDGPEGSWEALVARHIAEVILQPVRVDRDPLLVVRLLELRADDHVLIVALEHIISDAFSLNILIRDLFEIYHSSSTGRACGLPNLPLQFADYAAWQKNNHPLWLENHGAYWAERLGEGERLRFPEWRSLPAKGTSGWGTVPIELNEELKGQLREWGRQRRTTLVMSVLTAYVATVLRWCSSSSLLIRYQTDGRASPKVQNVIGYFASALHLRLQLDANDSFTYLLEKVVREYCGACEHADFGFISARNPAPDYTRNTSFNWVSCEPQAEPADNAEQFQETDQNKDRSFTTAPIRFDNPVLNVGNTDNEPVMLLYDTNAGVVGGMHFPLDSFSIPTMEEFRGSFLRILHLMLKHPDMRVAGIPMK